MLNSFPHQIDFQTTWYFSLPRLTELCLLSKFLQRPSQLVCNARDLGLIPGSGSSSGGGNGNPLQYSWLENPMDRGAWWAAVHGVVKSRTQQSTDHMTLSRPTLDAASTFKVASSCYQITETNLCLWVKSYQARFRAARISCQGAQCKSRNSRHLLCNIC